MQMRLPGIRNPAIANQKPEVSVFQKLMHNISDYKAIYLLMLPGILYFLIFKYGPMYGLVIAFENFTFRNGIFGSPWVGFKNFIEMFGSNKFYEVLRNTFLIQLYKLILAFPGPIMLSIMLNEVWRLRVKKTLQTVVYLPHFLSWSIVGGIFMSILAPDGILNRFMTMMELPERNWMMEPGSFRWIIVISYIWKEIGWSSIIYLAAISAIDQQLYEASIVDGARKWHQIRYITIPCLLPTIIIMFILELGRLLQAGFEQIYIMYNPVVYEVGDVFSTYVYRIGLLGTRYSYTTAVGVFESAVGFVLIFVTNKIANKISNGEYGIW